MSIKTMPVSDVRKTLNALLTDLPQPIFITQRGRVKAVLLSQEEYDQLIEELEDAADARNPEIAAGALAARNARRRGESISVKAARAKYGL